MPILVMCSNPACGELFDAPLESAGGEARCPACGTAVQVSVAARPPTVAQSAAPPVAPAAPVKAEPELVELDMGDAAPAEKDAGKGDAETRRGEKEDAEKEEGRRGDAETFSREPKASAQPSDAARPDLGARGTPPAREEVNVEDLFTAKDVPAAKQLPPATPRAPGVAGAAKEDDLLAEFWAGQKPAAGLPGAGSAPFQSAGEEAPDRRPVAALVFILGLVGMAAGLAGGLWGFPEYRLLAAYVGAGVGWVGGFTFGAMLVLGAEPEGGQAHCPSCGQAAPAGAETCPRCGGPIAGPVADPLTAECLYAGSYALSNRGGIMGPVLLTVAGQLVVSVSWELMQAPSARSGEWWPVVIALWVVTGFVVFSYWAEYLLSVISQTLARPIQPAKAPRSPRLGSFGTLAAGGKSLGVLVLYVAPLVTIPLLPLAALLLAYPAGKAAMNPAACARATWRHAKGFAVLWLFLLMWLAGMALAGVIVWILYGLRSLLPPVEGFTRSILSVTLSAFAVALAALVAGIFCVAMARCVGALGRYRPDLFPFASGQRKVSV